MTVTNAAVQKNQRRKTQLIEGRVRGTAEKISPISARIKSAKTGKVIARALKSFQMGEASSLSTLIAKPIQPSSERNVAHAKNRLGRPQNFHQKLFVGSSINYAIEKGSRSSLCGWLGSWRGRSASCGWLFSINSTRIFCSSFNVMAISLPDGVDTVANTGAWVWDSNRMAKINTHTAAKPIQALGLGQSRVDS